MFRAIMPAVTDKPIHLTERSPAMLASAAMMEVMGYARLLEAAVMRGANQEEQEALRVKARDVFETYLDLTCAVATLPAQLQIQLRKP